MNRQPQAIVGYALLAVLALCASPAAAQAAKVWDTREGRLCFEYWKTTALRTLNSHAGTDSFNAGKPYGFNEYGLWTFGDVGVRSTRPPDGWRTQYESNMYKWWWQPDKQTPRFAHDLEMRATVFPSLGKRSYVKRCMADNGFSVDDLGNVNTIGHTSETSTESSPIQEASGTGTTVVDGASASDDTICPDDPDRGVLAGDWETTTTATYIMKIPDVGRITYDSGKAYVVGKLKGRVFEGCWLRPGGNRCSNAVHGTKYWGGVSLVFDESFTRFKGSYTTCTTSGYALQGSWDGKRLTGEGLSASSAASTSSSAATGETPTSPLEASDMETGVDRLGGDFHAFLMTRASPQDCQTACELHRRCRAWTYVRPGVQADSAKCWLKSSVPTATANSCCTSGVMK